MTGTIRDSTPPGERRRAYFAHDRARQIAERVFWLASCSDTGAWGGKWAHESQRRHVYTNAYLIVGNERTLLFESGHSAVWAGMLPVLEGLLGSRPLDYVLPSHQELPHAGNLGRLATRWPALTVVGDVSDYLLYYPELRAEQLQQTPAGSVIDLGDVSVEVVAAIWHDLRTTLWAFAREPSVLFCVDGLQYSHEHASGDCGKVSGELEVLPSGPLVEVPARDTIKWARYTDLSGLAVRFRALLERLQPAVIAPSHGAPVVGNAARMVEIVLEGAEKLGRELHDG